MCENLRVTSFTNFQKKRKKWVTFEAANNGKSRIHTLTKRLYEQIFKKK